MDYSGFQDFPFPTLLSDEDAKTKAYFFTLSDEEQLALLNGSTSYDAFLERVQHHMLRD